MRAIRVASSWAVDAGRARVRAVRFAGYEVVSAWDGSTIAAITAFAAGAMLAMIADTTIPEAVEVAHDFAGLVTAAGLLVAFALSRVSG